MAVFICKHPGMVMDVDGTRLEVLPDGSWQATRPIGSLFGSPVEGQCRGVGKTHKEAMDALRKDQDKLYEGLWA